LCITSAPGETTQLLSMDGIGSLAHLTPTSAALNDLVRQGRSACLRGEFGR
jgi:hypothetical protein